MNGHIRRVGLEMHLVQGVAVCEGILADHRISKLRVVPVVQEYDLFQRGHTREGCVADLGDMIDGEIDLLYLLRTVEGALGDLGDLSHTDTVVVARRDDELLAELGDVHLGDDTVRNRERTGRDHCAEGDRLLMIVVPLRIGLHDGTFYGEDREGRGTFALLYDAVAADPSDVFAEGQIFREDRESGEIGAIHDRIRRDHTHGGRDGDGGDRLTLEGTRKDLHDAVGYDHVARRVRGVQRDRVLAEDHMGILTVDLARVVGIILVDRESRTFLPVDTAAAEGVTVDISQRLAEVDVLQCGATAESIGTDLLELIHLHSVIVELGGLEVRATLEGFYADVGDKQGIDLRDRSLTLEALCRDADHGIADVIHVTVVR